MCTCRASREGGAATPRFEDAPADLVAALDAFDTAVEPARRRALAAEVTALADDEEDALVLWHLLQDDDDAIALAAELRLATLVTPPPGLAPSPDRRATPAEIDLWKQELELLWW